MVVKKRKELPVEYLRECFILNEDYSLTWKVRPIRHFQSKQSWGRWNTLYAGKVAGTKKRGDYGYTVLKINGVAYLAHRVIWALWHGSFSQQDIDHIDGNPSNNHISNLRECSEDFHNQRNRKRNSNNTSGQMGVVWRADRSRWIAVYYEDRGDRTVAKKLGSFLNFDEAVQCRLKWEEDNNFTHRHDMI